MDYYYTLQITFWNASKWLVRQNVPMPEEDSLLFRSQLRIKELEEILRLKDIEIKSVRKKRFDQLEPLVIQDKVNHAKGTCVRAVLYRNCSV